MSKLKSSTPTTTTTTPPDLAGRVWAAWAFRDEDEARRAAAFLNNAEDSDSGTEFVLSMGTHVKQEDPDADEEDDGQGEGWNTSEDGARADVYKADGPAPWRMVWSCNAEPALSDTLESAEEEDGREREMWLSPFELSYAMREAGAGEVWEIDPKTGRHTGEAYDFGQPDRTRPFVAKPAAPARKLDRTTAALLAMFQAFSSEGEPSQQADAVEEARKILEPLGLIPSEDEEG